MDTKILLKAENISCIRQQKTLFANISFCLQQGEALLVEGANGVGKSSLLRLLTGLATPASGEITWKGCAIQESWEHLHYIGHTNGIKLGLTVNENLQLMCQLANVSTLNIDVVLQRLDLINYKNTPAANLSAGQKRRIALAKLFLIPKKLWVLDEPLTALDVATQELFLSALEEHVLQGGLAVISSHHHIQFKQARLQTLRLSA